MGQLLEFFRDEKRWTRDRDARTKSGRSCSSLTHEAYSFSVVGRIRRLAASRTITLDERDALYDKCLNAAITLRISTRGDRADMRQLDVCDALTIVNDSIDHPTLIRWLEEAGV